MVMNPHQNTYQILVAQDGDYLMSQVSQAILSADPFFSSSYQILQGFMTNTSSLLV
jgi:hypothetical protein